jgi:hypothetical protein
MIDTSSYDLKKSGEGFLTGGVSFRTNLSGFPFISDRTSSRLIHVEWEVSDDGKSVNQFSIDMANEKIILKDLKLVNLQYNKDLYLMITLGIQIVSLIVLFFLYRQLKYYKAAFIFLVPKLTLLYMSIGDLLLLIQ